MDAERQGDAAQDFYAFVTDVLPIGPEVLNLRDQTPPTELRDLSDQILIEEALRGEPTMIMADVLADHPDQPLERWWWHLGAIRRGTYPVALLPEHVRAVLAEAGRL